MGDTVNGTIANKMFVLNGVDSTSSMPENEKVIEYPDPDSTSTNAMALSAMILETLKELSDVIKDEGKQSTLIKCYRLLQRPRYKLVEHEHPYFIPSPKGKTEAPTGSLLTKTLVPKPR